MYSLKDYSFHLQKELIARFPTESREDSRLLVVERNRGAIRESRFAEFPSLIPAGSFIVVNDTRVVPARLFGTIDGRAVEMLVVAWEDERRAEALTRPAARFRPGRKVSLEGGIVAEVENVRARGRRLLRFSAPRPQVEAVGCAPLPPYIRRRPDEARARREFDLQRYQTVYARAAGAIAAPTAGLHFSRAMLEAMRGRIPVLAITLAVGAATFQPIEAQDIRDHRMGMETVTVAAAVRAEIERRRAAGEKLLAVGTTVVRGLESLAAQAPAAEDFATDLFIYPGFAFRLVDGLLTNFHLPESSLFILVSAFAGLDLMREAYRVAIEKKFRFFSYGDAMLIL